MTLVLTFGLLAMVYGLFRFVRSPIAKTRPRFAEQYLWTSFLHKHGCNAELKRYDEFSAQQAYISELSIASNLVILSNDQIGLELSTPNTGVWKPHTVYTHREWLRICRAYRTA